MRPQAAQKQPLLALLQTLFAQNELVVYRDTPTIDAADEAAAVDFLRTQYEQAAIDHPFQPPGFDAAAGRWAAAYLYRLVHLMVYRPENIDSPNDFLPAYLGQKTAAAILSADMVLRYLPGVLVALEKINLEDALIPLVERVLKSWHYSGLLSTLDLGELDFTAAYDDPCLQQLYVDRVIDQKRKKVGQHPRLRPQIVSALGAYDQQLWKTFNGLR